MRYTCPRCNGTINRPGNVAVCMDCGHKTTKPPVTYSDQIEWFFHVVVYRVFVGFFLAIVLAFVLQVLGIIS